MSAMDRSIPALVIVDVGSLDLTGTNETKRAKQANALNGPLLQRFKLSSRHSVCELWVPLGFSYVITTGITVSNAVVQLWRNGATVSSVATEGVATLPIAALGANEIFVPLSNYPIFTPTAVDAWSLKVITTATAGVVNPIRLVCGLRRYPGVTDGVAL